MRKIINIKIFALIFLLLFLPLFVGCFGAPPSPDEENQSPTITSTPITTATVDVLYTYDVEAIDPDDDTLTYTLTTSPTGMTINSTTGAINWTPGTEGDYDVTVEVSDGELLDTQYFIITVNPPCAADEPTVVTNDASNIEKTTATANGNITATGGEDCTVRGFQYGLDSPTPTWDEHSNGSFGTGSYSEGLSGLICESKYYIRAYATNCAGTDYGDWKSFNTADCAPCVADKPTVVTNDVSNIEATTTTANGNITATGGEDCTVRGFQYGLSQTPTWDKHSSGSFGTGSYSESLSGLTCDTTYYVRAYATNCAGTDYGDWKSFTTICPSSPTVVTNAVSSIGRTTATANGNITNTGGEDCTVRGFQYGLSQTPTWDKHSSGSFGTGSFSEGLTGLTPDTEYFVRAYATNSADTGYGDWESFTTDPPNLKLTPCPQSVTLGNQVTINIKVEDVTDLRGASVTLNFESELDYDSSSAGSFIPSATLMDSSTSSSVTLDIAGLGTSGYHSGMGSGTIITVVFDTIATASPTIITFGSTTLRDKDNNTISHTKGSGCSITIN